MILIVRSLSLSLCRYIYSDCLELIEDLAKKNQTHMFKFGLPPTIGMLVIIITIFLPNFKIL
jgi:hypothetical protein